MSSVEHEYRSKQPGNVPREVIAAILERIQWFGVLPHVAMDG